MGRGTKVTKKEKNALEDVDDDGGNENDNDDGDEQ